MMDLSARYVIILVIFSLCLEFKAAVKDRAAHDDGDSQIKSTFDLLKNGESEIKLSEDYKNIVLVLGNTGGGKSTFTQWIAGDNDKLIAKEVKEGTGEFIIEDNNRIGNSTIDSKTIFPELVVETKTNTAFYDCPGFSDTRSTSNDIATTYFIKKVVDHADSVKMVFVISYPSVRKGVDRKDFMALLRHATDLVKDIYKFQNSIAIVVTKIDNQYVKQGKSFVLVKDEKVIGAIADFLKEVKQDLEDKENRIEIISTNERKFYGNAIKFIDALLMKEFESYTKIGIFRRPDESGPLSNISLLREGKKNIEIILYENLNFTRNTDDDFGYTISEKSKNDINDLVEEINKNIWFRVSNVVEKMQQYYHAIVEQVYKKMQSFIIDNSVVDVNQTDAQIFSNKLSNGYNIISNLIKDIQFLKNPVHLATKINNSIGSLNVNLNEEDISDLSNQGQYFNFLQLVSDKELRTKPWAELFQSIVTYLMDSRKKIENDAIDIAQRINKQIKSDLNRIATYIKEHYYKRMELLEIQRLPAEFLEAYFVMFNLTEIIKNATTTEELSKAVYDCIKNLDFTVPKDNIISIAKKGHCFAFLQGVSDKKLHIQFSEWVYPFEDLVRYLFESEKWYTFLNSLYAKFSEYEIQRDREKYNVVHIEDWGKSGKSQGIEVTKSTFKYFLNKLTEFSVNGHDSVKNVTVTESQLAELNHVLSLTLRHSVSIQCKEPYIYIKGNYISMDQIDENKYFDSSCKNFTSRIKYVNLFALNTVFFDKDVPINVHGVLPVITVIAPKWEVIGNRKLELTGDKGSPQADKAKDGRHPGNTGDNGKPGEAGKPGGTFFGIGENFVNGQDLTIITSGGMGGPGQNGGNGQRGTSGSDAVVPSPSMTSCNSGLCDGNKQLGGFNCSSTNKCNYDYNEGIIMYDCGYKIFGTTGQKGGDGGNGGRGGKGGNAGDIIIFQLSNQSEISNYSNTGEDGGNGKGGDGAMFGDNGDDIVVECYSMGNWILSKYSWHLREKISNKKIVYGKNGVDGANYQGMENPEAAAVIPEPANIVNDYKSYLRENLYDRFKTYPLNQFLYKLENSNNVKNVYNTLGLANELVGLEKQFNILNKEKPSLFYESLLNRISEYAKNPKDAENSTQYKKILGYLYTATLSRIYNFKDNSESDLIIDVSGYLDIVKKDAETLKELRKEKNKADVIHKFTENYKSSIDEKIDEARNFITKLITPEIDNISSEIDNKVDLLINETIELQEQTKEEIKELIQKKQELENTLQIRRLFDYFKIIFQITSFFSPAGEVAGSVVGAVSTVTDSLVLDFKNSGQKVLKLPPEVTSILNSLIDHIKTFNNEKITSLNKLLDEMSEETIKYSEKLNDTSTKISSIKTKLSKLNKNRFDLKKIQSLEDELKQELKRKEKDLKAEEDTTDKKTASAIAIIDKFNKALQVGFDIYNKYKNDKAKLDAVSDAIEQLERKFQELKKYEETIYSIIGPMLKSMGDNLDDIASKLDTKSKVSLDITEWQVQGTLKDLKLQMKQLTNGSKVETGLMRCIEKLEDVMTTLINVYDRIQGYKEQQNLANYIGDISSVTSSQIQISDPKLNKILLQLEVLIRSNLVLKLYKTAADAFQQWVFPFAHLFIDDFTLPPQFELDDNMENLVSNAIEQIENMKSKIDVYKVSVKKGYDEYMLSEEFNSKYVSSEPFYVWKNGQYKDMISKLLSGQEVVVKADIMKSNFNKEAIKFSFIEFIFKARNETMQSAINDTLKGFNISVTHLGNSYYRYSDKIHVITSTAQTILYSFERNDKGEPIRKNNVYDKITRGDLMLSPYALWKIKLTNATSKITFNDLEVYEEEISLELAGYGSYAIRGVNIHSFIDNQYKAIDASNQLDANDKSMVVKRSNVIKLSVPYIPSEMDNYVIDMDDYMTNSAASSLSSPINNAFNFLKRNAIMVAGSLMQVLLVSKGAAENIRNETKTSLTETNDEIYDLKVTLNLNKEILNQKTEILAKRSILQKTSWSSKDYQYGICSTLQ